MKLKFVILIYILPVPTYMELKEEQTCELANPAGPHAERGLRGRPEVAKCIDMYLKGHNRC